MKPYEIIEHTADIGIKATGATLKELFENAAKGMFSIISGGEEQQETKEHPEPLAVLGFGASRKIKIEKEVEGIEELLVDWLSELLYIFNKEEILFSEFKVVKLNNDGIIGEASGKKVKSQSEIQTEIKAVTFHNLKIEETPRGFTCTIIFDV